MRCLVPAVLLLAALAGCGGPSEAHVVSAQLHDGIEMQMTLFATHDGLAVDARVENQRSTPVVLRQDGCGRVTQAEIARTDHVPRGRRWTGSVQALKRIVLRRQADAEATEALAPAEKCTGNGRTKTRTLKPGAVRHEGWRVAVRPSMLDIVGSKHAIARVQVFEPEKEDPTLQLERPVSSVARWPVSFPPGPSDAQNFDRLLADPQLRRVIADEPADNWTQVTISKLRGTLKLKALSDRYERAFVATAARDGSHVQIETPGPADLAIPYSSASADLPPGIGVIPESDGWEATHDVLPGDLELPTGRVAVDAIFNAETAIVDERAQPGAHPFRITLARQVGEKAENVALASLVVSDRPTTRWHYVETIGVDGGTALFSSAEGAEARVREPASANEADFDALSAHDFVADRPAGRGTNAMVFSTAVGDGDYDLFVGLDADGDPTRYVLDCGLIHFDWPKKA